MITINFTKAQDITKERLRAERKPLLEALDVEFMRNINDSAKITEIESKKQALRDITNKADLAKTLDELKAITV